MFIGVYLIMVNDPQILFNDGFYPLLHIVLPEGCLLRPRFPSALGCRTHALARLFDVLGGALCKNAPELNTASGYGTSPYMLYSGWDSKGDFFYSMEILYGGIPGRPIGDGMDGHSWWPLFENIPTEYLEAYYPMRIDGYTTVTDSGGPGFHRGGNGVEKRYVYLEPGEVSIHDDRWLTRPWGVLGGWPGARSSKLLQRADGTEEVLPSKCDRVEVRARRHARLPHGGRRRLEGPARPARGGRRARRRVRARLAPSSRRRATASSSGDAAATEAERARGSARSAARRSRSTSGRRSTRCSRTARRRRASSRRSRRRRCAGRRSSRATRRSRSCARRTDCRSPRRREVRGLPRARGLRPEARARGRRRQPRLHRPGLAARLRPRRVRRRDRGAARRRSAAPGCRSCSRRSATTSSASRRRRSSSRRCRRCSRSSRARRWVEIDPRIAPPRASRCSSKYFASAFFGTTLASLLASAGCDTVVVTGASTSGCVRATALDALQHGYRVVVPREAVGDRSPAAARGEPLRPGHEVRGRRLGRRGARVRGRAGGGVAVIVRDARRRVADRLPDRSCRRSRAPSPGPGRNGARITTR